jgi:Dolichyl-phosphate-mannose-protein mannosyltransferase
MVVAMRSFFRTHGVAILAIVAVVLVFRSSALLFSTADSDEGLFFVVTREVLHGHLPYVKVWEDKPPLFFALLAAFAKIFGLSIVGFRLAADVAVAAAALGLYRIGALLPFQGRLVGLAAALTYAGLTTSDAGLATEAELFSTPFIVWAAVCVLQAAIEKRALTTTRAFTIGCLLGAATQIKESSGLEAAYVAIVALAITRYGVRQVAVGLIGALAPIVLGILPFAITGNMSAYLDANVWTVFRHTHALNGPIVWPHMLREEFEAFFPSALLALTLVATMRKQNEPSARLFVHFVAGWAIVDVITLMAINEFSFQSLPLMAPLSLLGSWAVVLLVPRGPALRTWALGIAVLTLIVHTAGQFGTAGYVLYHRLADRDPTFGDDTAKLAQYLRAHRGSGDWLYVADDETVLYFLTDAPLPTRFPFPPHLINPKQQLVAGSEGQKEVQRIFDTRPQYVVYGGSLADSTTNFAVITANLRAHYRRVYAVGHRGVYLRM